MDICISSFDLMDKLILSIGLLLNGCKPVLGNCEDTVIKVEDGYVVKHRESMVKICMGERGNCSIILNTMEPGVNVYRHLFKRNGVEYSYITNGLIDHRLFTGLYTCMLYNGVDPLESFIQTFETLLKIGEVYTGLKNILIENRLLNDLLFTVEYVLNNKHIPGRLSDRRLIIGVKHLDNRVSTFEFTSNGRDLIIMSFKTVVDDGRFDNIPLGHGFVCVDDEGLANVVEEYVEAGFKHYLVNGYTCIYHCELYRVVLLLEKIIDSS